VPLATGGLGIATVMKMSALQLTETYITTGADTHNDIEQYCCFADDLATWAIYYATIAVTAQKSAE